MRIGLIAPPWVPVPPEGYGGTEAVVDTLVTQTLVAASSEDLSTVIVAGGVACNRRLRERMAEAAEERGLRAVFPSPGLCSDNAAMIAGLGHELLAIGRTADWHLDASPR